MADEGITIDECYYNNWLFNTEDKNEQKFNGYMYCVMNR